MSALPLSRGLCGFIWAHTSRGDGEAGRYHLPSLNVLPDLEIEQVCQTRSESLSGSNSRGIDETCSLVLEASPSFGGTWLREEILSDVLLEASWTSPQGASSFTEAALFCFDFVKQRQQEAKCIFIWPRR